MEKREGISSERTAVYIRNHTQVPIDVGSGWEKYREETKGIAVNSPSKAGEDYWHHGVTIINPGEMRKVLTFDDMQNVEAWRDTYFKIKPKIGGHRPETVENVLAMIHMEVEAGVASYKYLANLKDGGNWTSEYQKDGFIAGGEWYEIHCAKNGDKDIFFTICDPNGNGGFFPHRPSYADEITVMNYNTYLLIGPITSGEVDDLSTAKPDFCDRASEMPSNIPMCDVLILNEMSGKAYCTPDAIELPDYIIKKGHYKYTSKLSGKEPSVAGPGGLLSTGGVRILSTYPQELILDQAFSVGEDGMPKGFLIVKVTKSDSEGNQRDYYIVGTHTTSGKESGAHKSRFPYGRSNYLGIDVMDTALSPLRGRYARRFQFDDIARAIAEHVPSGARVIIGGDLNVFYYPDIFDEHRGWEIGWAKQLLKADEFGWDDIVPHSYSITGNYYANDEDEGNQAFDWILYSQVKPDEMYWRYVPIRSMSEKVQPWCDLSDHYAVYAEMKYASLIPVRVDWPSAKTATYGSSLEDALSLPSPISEENGRQVSVIGIYSYSLNDKPIDKNETLPAGSYDLNVTFTPNDLKKYLPANGLIELNIFKATMNITWSNPDAIVQGTSLGEAQLNAVARAEVGGRQVEVKGTYSYYWWGQQITIGTKLPAGLHTLEVKFEPEEIHKFEIATGSVPLRVWLAEEVLNEGKDQTFSHLALKYYRHATPHYWQWIIDANKGNIPDDYRRTRPGTKIFIPEKPSASGFAEWPSRTENPRIITEIHAKVTASVLEVREVPNEHGHNLRYLKSGDKIVFKHGWWMNDAGDMWGQLSENEWCAIEFEGKYFTDFRLQ